MDPRPTPTSPRFAHRYPTPAPPNVPQLLTVALVAAGLAVLCGAVLLRVFQRPTVTVTPGASQPTHPLERVREQRASATLPLLDGTVIAATAVAVSSDGWVVGYGDGGSDVRTADGVRTVPVASVRDGATGARFRRVEARLDPVPFANREDRYTGEPLAVVLPGTLPGEYAMLSATLAAVRMTVTGSDVQRSDASPTVVRIQVDGAPPSGAPVFTLSGQLLGVVRSPGPDGTVDLVPAWHLRSALDRLLSGGTVPRASLGLTGRPAEIEEPGTTGFRVEPGGVPRGSAAATAGIAAGTVIVAVGDALVGPDGALGDLLLAYSPAETVSLRIRSGTGERVVELTLGTLVP